MYILLLIVHVIVCLFLIVVVLLQSGKAADLAGALYLGPRIEQHRVRPREHRGDRADAYGQCEHDHRGESWVLLEYRTDTAR